MEAEWIRWLIGTAIGLVVIAFGAYAAAVHDAKDRDRRVHERIDRLIGEQQLKIDALREEAKHDRHELVARVTGVIEEQRNESLIYRGKMADELKAISEQLGEIRGILKKGRLA